jgi:hypothetical protein
MHEALAQATRGWSGQRRRGNARRIITYRKDARLPSSPYFKLDRLKYKRVLGILTTHTNATYMPYYAIFHATLLVKYAGGISSFG